VSTTRRRAYLIAIGIGCVALAVDRFILTESATAPQDVNAAGINRTTLPEEPADAGQTPVPAVPFPRNLPAFDPTRDIRDVFVRPSDAIAGDDEQQRGPKSPKTGDPKEATSAAEFVTRHTLSAVLDDGRLKIAVVDGLWMRVGDAFDDCRLTSVSGTAARFRCPDGDAVLDIAASPVRIRD